MRKLLWLVPLLPSLLLAQPTGIRLNTDSVISELSVMAAITHQLHTEQSRCITRWRMERNNGRLTISVLALGPAEVAAADSVQIWFYPARVAWDTSFVPRVCGDSLPDVHSHIVNNGYLFVPSDIDSATAARHPAPFRLLMSVIDSSRMSVRVYGVKGRP